MIRVDPRIGLYASAEADDDGAAREALRQRFRDRLIVRRDLNRRLVSYQANKEQPGLRWFKYKEGFSAELVRAALRTGPGPVLDPFAGEARRPATGIEIMPVGARAARAIALAAQLSDDGRLERAARGLLEALGGRDAEPAFRFPHVPITARAFPPETEDAIAKARAFLDRLEEGPIRSLLDVACMSVLEEVSYTRKDGQYLRWDLRCGRALRGGMHKGPIPGYAKRWPAASGRSGTTRRCSPNATAAARRGSSKAPSCANCRGLPTGRSA